MSLELGHLGALVNLARKAAGRNARAEPRHGWEGIMTTPLDDGLRRTAERRVDAKLSFRIHLFVYLMVNSGLLLLNLVTSPGYLWCLWSMFGWGVGLIAHGYAVYGLATRDRQGLIAAEVTRLRRDRDGAAR